MTSQTVDQQVNQLAENVRTFGVQVRQDKARRSRALADARSTLEQLQSQRTTLEATKNALQQDNRTRQEQKRMLASTVKTTRKRLDDQVLALKATIVEFESNSSL